MDEIEKKRKEEVLNTSLQYIHTVNPRPSL